MRHAQLTVIDSNSAEHPPGSRVEASSNAHGLAEIAGHEVEDVTYYARQHYVKIQTALGYQFTVSLSDYHLLIAE